MTEPVDAGGSARQAAPGASLGDVILDVDGPVATITLNRPSALNALTIPMKERLLEVLGRVGEDRGVRVVILTGAGRAFCAGQDLKERLEPGAPPLGEELTRRYNPIARALRTIPQPVIAAVNGVAAGAGASLAFACDLRIAAESASFVLAFGRIGLVPDTGATWTLPRLVGAARASEIALLGDPVSAADALRIGLVSRIVPADDLASGAAALAARLAAGAPLAMTLTKRALGAAFERDLDAALAAEADAQERAGSSRDHAEGLTAFVEKRAPRFTGE